MTFNAPLAAALLSLAPALALAQSAPLPLPLTLDEAVTRALKTSHRLGEARARQQAAAATVDVRRRTYDPSVTATVGYTRTNHVDEFGVPQPNGLLRVIYPDIPDNYRSRVELVWPIYVGGRTEALESAARAEVDATAHDLEAARLDLHLEVTRAYWALVTARDTVRVLEQALATADHSLADVRARVEAGFLPPNDVSRSLAQRARSELLLVEARGRVEAVTVDLARLIGLDPPASIEPTEGLETGRTQLPDANTLVSEAVASRPEVLAIQGRSEAITARLGAIAAARKPTVSFVSGYDFASPNPRIFPRQSRWDDSFDLTLNVSWPLWDSGRAQADRVETLANQAVLTERKREVETQVAADVRKSLVDVTTSRAALTPARLALTSARETRRVVNDRFEAGVATTLDVLDAQLAEMQSELDVTRVLADIRLAEARLRRVVGR